MKYKNLDELKRALGPACQQLNADVLTLGANRSRKPKQDAGQALEQTRQGQGEREDCLVHRGKRVRVTLVAFRSRQLDSDNLIGGLKPLRDAIACYLGIDDADKFIDWEYGQVSTQGETGVTVKIEVTTIQPTTNPKDNNAAQ